MLSVSTQMPPAHVELTDQAIRRYLDIVEVHRARADAARPDLVERREGDTRGVPIDQEQAQPLPAAVDLSGRRGASDRQDVVGFGHRRDPNLLPVHDVLPLPLRTALVAVANVSLPASGSVSAMQKSCGAVGDPREQALLELLGAVAADRLAAEYGRRHEQLRERRPTAAATRGLDDEHRVEKAHSLAAIILGDRHPEPTVFSKRPPQLGRKRMLGVFLPPVIETVLAG